MHRSIISFSLHAFFLLFFGIISSASPRWQPKTVERTTPSKLVPRVFEGFPVAESDAGGWRILLKQHALFLPARDAIQDVSSEVFRILWFSWAVGLSSRPAIGSYLASTPAPGKYVASRS